VVFVDYRNTIQSIFDTGLMKPATREFGPIRYAVVLREGSRYWEETCMEFTAGSSETLCSKLTNQETRTDHDTGLRVPLFRRGHVEVERTPTTFAPETNTGIGTAYIPTEDGPVMLQVIIEYGTRR
jgi:hypothetical protein